MARATDKRWKGILIDWNEISDMDADDYELKPLNQQQTAILLALLEYQKWPTRWLNLGLNSDELETYIADIEQRLMRNEGEGMATKEDIRDGMYEAMNRLALQVASGQFANLNITTDENGAVSMGDGGIPEPELPEDDPSTPINEQDSSYYGGVAEIAAKLESVTDKIDALYGNVNNTPATVEATTQTIMRQYFPCDENLMQAAVSAYYAYRVANNQLSVDRGTSLPLYLYCNGYDTTAQYKWLQDVSGYAFAKQQIIYGLWASLSTEFYTRYFAIGSQVPSNQYLDAACVPMPYQEFLDILYASTRNLSPAVAKGGHRLKIRVSGHYVDPDGDIQDAFWYRTAAGVLTRSNFTFSHAAGANMPSDNQVPYNASHIYEYTIDLSTAASSWSVTFNRNAGMNVASTSPSGGFDIQITDVGLAVSA